MSTYLHIANGDAGLLVDIAHVVEVAEIAVHGDAAGLRHWREGNLPAVDLAARLGGRVVARQQVILRNTRDGDASLALDVEHILDLLEIDETTLQPLNDFTHELARVIDAAWAAPDGRCLLRLRAPFTWATDGLPPQTGENPP